MTKLSTKLAITLTLIMNLLSGCGNNDGTIGGQLYTNHGYGFGYDGLTTKYGIRYRVDDGYGLSPGIIDNWFEKTSVCMGILDESPDLTVIFTENVPDKRYRGSYFPSTNTIVMQSIPSKTFARTPYVLVSTYKHEVIHYLLDEFYGDADRGHLSDYWTRNQPGELPDCENANVYEY